MGASTQPCLTPFVTLNDSETSPPILTFAITPVRRLTYSSSSSPVGHKATTIFRHKVLSLAEASPHDSPISLSSAITVCRHVIFGRPRFLFPGGVNFSGHPYFLSSCHNPVIPTVSNPLLKTANTMYSGRSCSMHFLVVIGDKISYLRCSCYL